MTSAFFKDIRYMASSVSSTVSAQFFVTSSERSLIHLIDDEIAQGDFDNAHKHLLLQLTEVQEKDLLKVYQYIFQLLDHGNSIHFAELEERLVLTSFLKQSSHLPEQQRTLALQLGHSLLRLGPSNPLLATKMHSQAMEY